MASSQRNVVYVSITSEGNYYSTQEQVNLRCDKPELTVTDFGGSQRSVLRHTEFKDSYDQKKILAQSSGNLWWGDLPLEGVSGVFSRQRFNTEENDDSDAYAVTSIVLDSSGASRNVLSRDIDYCKRTEVDAFRQGVEITTPKRWTAAVFKISAGEPGHLIGKDRFGLAGVSVVDPDVYFELSTLNPVGRLQSNELDYPHVVIDANDAENYATDGIIEPLTIRNIITKMSLYYPYEPHSFKSNLEAGNLDSRISTDRVLTVDYIDKTPTRTPYFDATRYFSSALDESGVIRSPKFNYFKFDVNLVDAWDDRVDPRRQNLSQQTSYDSDLITALSKMMTSSIYRTYVNAGEAYVSEKQRAATSGFVYNNTTLGTDSIAYGGLTF